VIGDVERRVLEAVDVDGLVGAVCEMVAIRSVGGTESVAQEHVAALMSRCGLDVEAWKIDLEALSQHPAYGTEIPRERALGVVGTMGAGQGGRSLIWNGHVDVVPAGDEANWHYPPWQGTVDGGRLYGRGAVDMKGGLCCGIYAAKALRDAGVALRGKVMVQSVIGEEDGGVGTLAAIERGYTADGAVVLEPTELVVAPAHGGGLDFRVTVPGLSAHGAMREEGVSAVEKFIPLYRALAELERVRNEGVDDPLFARYRIPYSISVGTVRAGNWPSTVAEALTFEGRCGVRVGEDAADARRALEDAVQTAAKADPWLRDHVPVVEWLGAQFESSHIAVEHPLVGALARAYQAATGSAATMAGMTYGADMRLLVNVAGIPTVLFGPGDPRQAHRPDEFVPLADLEAATRTLVLLAVRYCGVGQGRG
jgi:acetylornithine deacetylase